MSSVVLNPKRIKPDKMLTIRQLEKSDASAFKRIRLFALLESPTAFGSSHAQEKDKPIESFEQRIERSPDRWVTGAFQNNELVGTVGFVRDLGLKSRHKGFIWGMYVMPEHRGSGIGKAIFKDTLSHIERISGLRRIRLSVTTSNTPALEFYKSLGFSTYGEENEALYIDGAFYSEYYMAKSV